MWGCGSIHVVGLWVNTCCGVVVVKTSDCQSREPGFKSSCCHFEGQFCLLNIALVHSAVNVYLATDRGVYLATDRGGYM